MVKIISNILSEQSLKNIQEFWSPDKERRISNDINGHKRDVVMLDHETVVELTGDDLAGYYVHSGFLGLAGEPYKIHCDKGNNPITHNLCINLLTDEELAFDKLEGKEGRQSLVLFNQRSKYRMILVNYNTPPDVIAEYVRVQYIPVTYATFSTFVENGVMSVTNEDLDLRMAEEQEMQRLLAHTWGDCIRYMSIDRVIEHRYNQGIEFDAHTLHCGSYAEGDHKRMVLYVRKLD